jgi:hypothetical protein
VANDKHFQLLSDPLNKCGQHRIAQAKTAGELQLCHASQLCSKQIKAFIVQSAAVAAPTKTALLAIEQLQKKERTTKPQIQRFKRGGDWNQALKICRAQRCTHESSHQLTHPHTSTVAQANWHSRPAATW